MIFLEIDDWNICKTLPILQHCWPTIIRPISSKRKTQKKVLCTDSINLGRTVGYQTDFPVKKSQFFSYEILSTLCWIGSINKWPTWYSMVKGILKYQSKFVTYFINTVLTTTRYGVFQNLHLNTDLMNCYWYFLLNVLLVNSLL